MKEEKNEESGTHGQFNTDQADAKEKRLSIPPKEVRRLMIETLRKSRRKPEPGEIGAAAKGLKSMKIDRKIRKFIKFSSIKKKIIKIYTIK